jgi:hypothetical protein
VTFASLLPLWWRVINRYEALALFLVIQTPLALLYSKNPHKKTIRKNRRIDEYRKRVAQRWGNPKPAITGPFAFLLRVLVIAALWALFLFWENTSGDPIVRWLARSLYFILASAWIMNVSGRANDAGLAEGWYGSQYALVVCVASFMPLAFHWVDAYGALAIFVLIQIPTMFLRSKPVSEEAPSN